MSKVKLLISGAVFVSVFELLHSYRMRLMCLKHLRGMQMVWINNLKIPYCILVAGLIALFVFVLLYHKKVDLDMLQEDYVRSRLNMGTLESIDGMDEAGKHDFYQERIKHFTYEQNQDCLRYMQSHMPKSNGVKKNVLLVLIVISLAITFSPIWIQYRVVKAIEKEDYAVIEDTYNQIIDEEYFVVQNLPKIHIVGGSKLKAGDVQRYLNEFVKTQPQILLDHCHQIDLCSPKKFEKYAREHGLDFDNKGYGTYAYSSLKGLSITLQVDLDEYNDQFGSVTHELAHIYDFAHYSPSSWGGIGYSEDWIRLYKSDQECFGDYGSTDPSEFFAEATEMYVNDPEELEDLNVDIYNYLNNLYQMYV